MRPQKTETHKIRLTESERLIGYPGYTKNPASYIITTKTHWNIIRSKEKADTCIWTRSIFTLAQEKNPMKIH